MVAYECADRGRRVDPGPVGRHGNENHDFFTTRGDFPGRVWWSRVTGMTLWQQSRLAGEALLNAEDARLDAHARVIARQPRGFAAHFLNRPRVR